MKTRCKGWPVTDLVQREERIYGNIHLEIVDEKKTQKIKLAVSWNLSGHIFPNEETHWDLVED